jgi:hypothetical protein
VKGRLLPAVAAAGLLSVLAIAPPPASAASSAGELTAPIFQPNTRAQCFTAQYQAPDYRCPPAAMAAAVLSNGHVLFWDGLEGMADVQHNTVLEFGGAALNDQSRVATFTGSRATFVTPRNQTGAPTGGHTDQPNAVLPGRAGVADGAGAYDLFCAPLVQLPDGRLLTAGGTHYYDEPGVVDPASGNAVGLAELQGLRATREFIPNGSGGAWQNVPGGSDLHYGRWYPTMVTLPDGRVFIASGVTKLIKPFYTDDRPMTDSGRNVVETETFDPRTNRWTLDRSSRPSSDPTLADASQQSLPLFARLHLLPDGKVYYDAGGQSFNPDGQGYDEATWSFAKIYDPRTQAWSNLQADTATGLPLVGGLPIGFRGSAFSVLLPLTYRDGYTKAGVFSGGGVIGQTPGTDVADDTTTIDTVDTAHGDALHSAQGPTLLNRRWYGSAVLLPDGEVFVTSGADKDEVVGPGSGAPVTATELVDPQTAAVTAGPSLDSRHGRTYHNTAVLLPDARVLIGGHAPINTMYAYQSDAGSAAGLSRPEADSTFQIYSPPYLSYRSARGKLVARPAIASADPTAVWGAPLHLTSTFADEIGKVVLVRDGSVTHLTDGDQRTVELRITKIDGRRLTLAVPGPTVLPPGPYMLFVERAVRVGGTTRYVPSVARHVRIG